MTTPNRFARNGSFLIASTYDADLGINKRFISLPNGQWFIKDVVRFTNSDENEDANITISNGNITQFSFNALSAWLDINGIPVQTPNLDEILDFFFQVASGGTTDNGVYMCDISFSGNNVDTDKANSVSIAINGNTVSFNKTLDDFGSITSNVNQCLSDAGVTCTGVLVSTVSNLSDIASNTGFIEAYVQIFYPSAPLVGNMEWNINGTPQTFTFDKIPTA